MIQFFHYLVDMSYDVLKKRWDWRASKEDVLPDIR